MMAQYMKEISRLDLEVEMGDGDARKMIPRVTHTRVNTQMIRNMDMGRLSGVRVEIFTRVSIKLMIERVLER